MPCHAFFCLRWFNCSFCWFNWASFCLFNSSLCLFICSFCLFILAALSYGWPAPGWLFCCPCWPFTFLKAFTHLLLIFPVTFALDKVVNLKVNYRIGNLEFLPCSSRLYCSKLSVTFLFLSLVIQLFLKCKQSASFQFKECKSSGWKDPEFLLKYFLFLFPFNRPVLGYQKV